MYGKTNHLKYQIKEANVQIFTVQETKYRKKGKFNIDEFEIFESKRKNKEKGGTMLGIHKSLEPVLIEEYSNTFELIVAEIHTNNKQIRIITGYGPQENWSPEEKRPFFIALEEEVVKAHTAGKPCIIEIDANSKLGSEYVKGDPHDMSVNGKILSHIIETHALIVANGVEGKSSGVVTRKRLTESRLEESVIDYVLISDSLLPSLVSCHVNSQRKKIFTKFTIDRKCESDHNSIFTRFRIE